MSDAQEDIDMLENMLDGYPNEGFTLEKQALTAAIKALENQGASEWISVGDRRPPFGVDVLLIDYDVTQYETYYIDAADKDDYHTIYWWAKNANPDFTVEIKPDQLWRYQPHQARANR